MNDNLAPPNFTRRKCFTLATGAFVLLSSRYLINRFSDRAEPLLSHNQELKLIEGFSQAFGTTISVKIAHADPGLAQAAIDAMFNEIEAIEQIMSLYRSDSQICRLNRQGWLDRPHPYLIEVLQTAQRISALSNGAFDVTVQPLWDAYTNSSGLDAIEIARRQVNCYLVGFTIWQLSKLRLFSSPSAGNG